MERLVIFNDLYRAKDSGKKSDSLPCSAADIKGAEHVHHVIIVLLELVVLLHAFWSMCTIRYDVRITVLYRICTEGIDVFSIRIQLIIKPVCFFSYELEHGIPFGNFDTVR